MASWTERRPVLASLATLAGWFAAASLIVVLLTALTPADLSSTWVQMAGFCGATLALLVVAWRGRWLSATCMASLGSWRCWLLVAPLAAYDLALGLGAFFGEARFSPTWLWSGEAGRIWALQAVVGPAEEILFRGAMLAILMNAWGKTRGGVLRALAVQAALFGSLHTLQALAGSALPVALANVLHTCVFGLWVGALTLICRSVWPAALLHTLANALTLIKGEHTPWLAPYGSGYLRLTLFEMPLVALTLWLLWRRRPWDEQT